MRKHKACFVFHVLLHSQALNVACGDVTACMQRLCACTPLDIKSTLTKLVGQKLFFLMVSFSTNDGLVKAAEMLDTRKGAAAASE